jgi:CubicO group peptidase (beta-lactamase class C family)
MQVAAPFRTRLVYWNIGYAIAGEAAAAAAGMSWEDLVAQRLFAPLKMERTTDDFDAVPAMGNYASGHALVGGVHGPIPRETARRSTAPAGVIHASVADLAKWMLFQLGDGTWEGKRLLSAAAMNEMHSPQIVFTSSPEFRASRQVQFFPAYGMGWQVFDHRGHALLWHSGNGDGQLAYVALLPDQHLGVAVLVNSWRAGPALNGGIASRIMDHYLGLPTRDYSAEMRDGWNRNQQRQADDRRALEAARLPDTRPSLPLTAYAGGYRDRIGLDVRIWLEADSLHLQYGGGEPATLGHWHDETFLARWQNPFHAELLPMFVTFGIDPEGAVDRLRMNPYGDELEARRMAP